MLTVGRPSVQARKRRGRFSEECHLIRQRLVDFIAQFDGFVSIDPAMDSFSVLVKRVFVALPKVARFIAKCLRVWSTEESCALISEEMPTWLMS